MKDIMNKLVPLRADIAVYHSGVAARMSGIGPRTLDRLLAAGLVGAGDGGERPLFSANDIRWLGCLRSMMAGQRFTIAGIKKMLELMPCWEAADCPADVHCRCSARSDRREATMPRLGQQGNGGNEAQAAAGSLRCSK
ncbi:MAG: MerR family transcriptional regulator [Thermodesulfobacteriota bacterium]